MFKLGGGGRAGEHLFLFGAGGRVINEAPPVLCVEEQRSLKRSLLSLGAHFTRVHACAEAPSSYSGAQVSRTAPARVTRVFFHIFIRQQNTRMRAFLIIMTGFSRQQLGARFFSIMATSEVIMPFGQDPDNGEH